MTTATTARFEASATAARTGFFALAAAVTFTLLAGVSQIANGQVQDVQMAQGDSLSAPAAQVVVIVGKRTAA